MMNSETGFQRDLPGRCPDAHMRLWAVVLQYIIREHDTSTTQQSFLMMQSGHMLRAAGDSQPSKSGKSQI